MKILFITKMKISRKIKVNLSKISKNKIMSNLMFKIKLKLKNRM